MKQEDKMILATKNGYDIVDDKKMGYIHIEPLPSEEDLQKIYEEEYYTQEKTEYIDNTIKDLAWWQSIYRDKYETFETLTKGRKLLDIGCGSGFFIKYGSEYGWDCIGVEPSKQAANYAIKNNLNVKNKFFNKEDFTPHTFDIIHLNNVLEHIPNPTKLIQDIYTLLKKDGLICISVPNDFSPLQNMLWKNMEFQPWWLSPPHHLNYFTPKSLSTLLQNNGFSISLEEGSFPLELFLLMGEDYINNSSLGREIHTKRKRFDMALSQYDNNLKRKLYQSFAKLGLGRLITIYAQKV